MQYIAYNTVSDSSICSKYPVINVLTLCPDIYIFVLVYSNHLLKPVRQLTHTGITWLITLWGGGLHNRHWVLGTQMPLFCIP